jgi:hypothetical protein
VKRSRRPEVPSYWENPLTGRVEDPPAPTFEEWAAARPFHLADEIVRAEEHVAGLHESWEKITAAGDAQGVVFQLKLDRTDEMIFEAEGVVAGLREQAAIEYPDGTVDRLIESSAQRRAVLVGHPVNAYGRYLEGLPAAGQPGIAQAQTAEVQGS